MMLYLITFCDGTSQTVSEEGLGQLYQSCIYNPWASWCCIVSIIPYTPPPTYPCPYCGLPFASQAELNSHIAAAHPTTPTTYLLTVNINPAGAGGVELTPWGEYVAPGRIRYAAGTSVTMRAVFFGQVGQFDHWEGDVTGATNPTTIVMNKDKVVTAVFIIGGETYELTTSVVGSGVVYPSSGVYNPGDQIILSATPVVGWAFSSWLGNIDGCTPVPGMPNQLQVVMDRNRHIIASFSMIGVSDPTISGFDIVDYSKV